MPRDPSGNYTAPVNSWNPAVNNTVIDPNDWNDTLTDLEDAMTDSLSRTGEGGMLADLDMDGNDIIGIATAVFDGSVSGATTLQAAAVAGGTTITMPAATDTLVGLATADTLTNKTLTSPVINGGTLNFPAINARDNTFVIVGSADASKRLFFEVDGFTTATDRTVTVPDANLTMVGLATSQALTNKTYNGNTWTAGTGTLTIAAAKTFTSNNTLILNGTDGASISFGLGGTVIYNGGALGTPSSGTLTNCTGLPLSGHTNQAAWTFVVNNTSGSAAPTAVDIATFTTKASPAAGDYVILSDQAASGALKKATVSSIASAGSVSSIAGNTGAFTLGYGLTNSVNDLRASLTSVTNSLGANVTITPISTYVDGPSVAQGSSGTWYASGTVTLVNNSAATNHYSCKLWDGTTVIDSARFTQLSTGAEVVVALSGVITSPAGNIRISVSNSDNNTAAFQFNLSGNSKDCTVTAIRIAP